MSNSYYPPLDGGLKPHLETVRLHLMEDLGYLRSEDCPYSDDLRAYLANLLGGAKASSSEGFSAPLSTDGIRNYTAEDLETEAERLFFELEDFGNRVKGGEASEQASYFRVAAALLEKILSAKEKAANLKEFGRLIGFLMQFAEDQMSVDQRTKFMDGLKAFSNQ